MVCFLPRPNGSPRKKDTDPCKSLEVAGFFSFLFLYFSISFAKHYYAYLLLSLFILENQP